MIDDNLNCCGASGWSSRNGLGIYLCFYFDVLGSVSSHVYLQGGKKVKKRKKITDVCQAIPRDPGVGLKDIDDQK